MKLDLYPHQRKGVDDLRDAFRAGFKSPIFVLPTGGGKTHVFTEIAISAAGNGFRVWIVVHRSYLWRQASNKLRELGVSHGIIAPGHTQTVDNIQVASVDTLIKRLNPKMIPPDLIIYDEAHHVIPDNKWGKIARFFYNARIIGVTATPIRTNGQGLGVEAGGFFDKLVMGPQIVELVPNYLTPYKLFAPEINVDLKGIRRVAGDYNKKELESRFDKKKIYGNVPGHYMKICPGVPAIAFCVSVKHCEIVANEFNEHGISAAAVSGKTPENRRNYLFNGLADGKYKVLCSCDLVSEGLDVKACGAAISLRPTQSLGLCLQQWGRAGRKSPGKEWSYVIDHVGNHIDHGYPWNIRNWDLTGTGTKRKINTEDEETLTKRTCPKCWHVHTPCPVCPNCGFKYINMFKKPAVVDVELKEISSMAAIRKEEMKKKSLQRKKNIWACKTLEDLYEYAKNAGYKKRWADTIWDARIKKKYDREEKEAKIFMA